MGFRHQSKSAFQSRIANVPGPKIPHSKFDRSHTLKTAIWDDIITPVFIDEILPGDTVSIAVNAFARLNPTITPLMDNVWMDVHAFFVPNRLVHTNWVKLMGEQDDPGDSTDFLTAKVSRPSAGWSLYSNGDYYGLPLSLSATNKKPIAYPFRGYGLIYNTWYRDENLQDSVLVPKDDGPDNPDAVGYPKLPLPRNKRHDYFTSNLPWPQKGPAIPLLPDSVPVTITNSGAGLMLSPDGTTSGERGINMVNATATMSWSSSPGISGNPVRYVSGLQAEADLTVDTVATINALRNAFALQSLSERDARGGTRYTELITAHFGVISPDARLQRPEYLGGSSSLVIMNPLAQTSSTDATTPQGNLVGNGVAMERTHFSKSFTEHGFIHIFVSFRGDLSYSQGLDRFWTRDTKWDYYWPDLANIGEQATLKGELLITGFPALDEAVFGYLPRYEEYRSKKNWLSANMRPGVTDTTDYWHLSQELGDAVLGSGFIRSNTPFDRVMQVPTQPTFLCDFYFDYKHTRPMGTYSIPGGLTRF